MSNVGKKKDRRNSVVHRQTSRSMSSGEGRFKAVREALY